MSSIEFYLPTLRDYQERMLADLYALIREHGKVLPPVIGWLPTGGGKTNWAVRVMVDAYRKAGLPSLFVVDQDNLVVQTAATLRKWYGVECGIIKAGYEPDLSHPFQVASIGTIASRGVGCLPPASVVVIDECHTSYSKQWDILFEHYSGSLILGLTATPWRTVKKEGLGERFGHIIVGPSVRDLMDQFLATEYTEGLSEAIYYGFSVKVDVSGVKKGASGDYQTKALKVLCDRPEIIERLPIEWWTLMAPNGLATARKTLVSAIDCEHADHIAAAFVGAGIPAASVHSKIDKAVLADRFRRHKQYKPQPYRDYCEEDLIVLVSVDMLTKGYDDPEVAGVVMARATNSEITYRQFCGRGLRPAPWIDKRDCVFLDAAGNFGLGDELKFGPLDTVRRVTLNGDVITEGGEMPMRECPECHAWGAIFKPICDCGNVFPIAEKPIVEVLAVERLASPHEKVRMKKFASAMKTAYRKGWLPGKAVKDFQREFGENVWPRNEWYLGAVFGETPNARAKQAYWTHLQALASAKAKDLDWCKSFYRKEFGPDADPSLIGLEG